MPTVPSATAAATVVSAVRSDPPYLPDSPAATRTRDITLNHYINCQRGGDQIRSTLGTTARLIQEGQRVNVSSYTTNPYSTSMDLVACGGKVFLDITISRFVWTGPATYLEKGYELRPLEALDRTELEKLELFPQNHKSEIPAVPLRFQFEENEVGLIGKARLELFDLSNHPFDTKYK